LGGGDNRRAMHPYRRWLVCACIAAGCPALAQERVPSFAELEAAGARIGAIGVDTHNIFDPGDPRERNFLFRAANALHVKTQPWLIRRLLLFHSGDRVRLRLIEETERLIRLNSTVYDVEIRPVRYQDGVVDVEVRTRDTWTLQPGVKFRREGGVTSDSFTLKETNLAGTGTTAGIERSASVDRTGTALQLSHDHLFDGWTSMAVQRARYNDGSSESFSVDRPFYALETTWAAGASAQKFDRLDSIYQSGNNVAQYRHRQDAAEVHGGWSRGLVDGWTRRYSAGVNYQADSYTLDPSHTAPSQLPPDKTLAGPFVRYEAIEDDFMPVVNRDLIQRPEYFAMGWHPTVQLGRSLAAFGATDQPWQMSASVSKGFRASAGHELLTSAGYSSQYGSSTGDVRSLNGSARYFVPQTGSFLVYLAGSYNHVRSPNIADELLLGGDNGLRGYPLRYQRGTHSALFTAEERFYTDWYPLRLFRVGAALYYDVGRAWGSQLPNAQSGWLHDVGIGLRILSARASFGNVLHIDLAFPVHNTDPGVKARQLLIQTAKTF
jgi:outer membrane protein assembly factor BamA